MHSKTKKGKKNDFYKMFSKTREFIHFFEKLIHLLPFNILLVSNISFFQWMC